jgi:hypothetical protein
VLGCIGFVIVIGAVPILFLVWLLSQFSVI